VYFLFNVVFGNAIVIMDTEEYHKKMMEHLTTIGSYKKFEKDPNNKIMREITKAIQISSLEDMIKEKITPKNLVILHIYGLPKIHKEGCYLRPIVNTIGSPLYGLAKLLTEKLKPLYGHTQSFIKDSHFIQNIKSTKVNEAYILVSFDVVSLYTKIPLNDAINVIRRLTDNETTNLVEVCLKYTYYSFGGDIYERTNGVAMGSLLSPVVANIFMEYFEEKTINTSPLKLEHWR
jgi:hypothetical protein